MNKTETVIKAIQNSVDENETLDSISHNVWNFTSIMHAVELIQHIKEQEEFNAKFVKHLMKERDNLVDQLLQLQCEYDEMKEERDLSQEALQTLQNKYDGLESEDKQKGLILEAALVANNENETELLTKNSDDDLESEEARDNYIVDKKRDYIKERKVPKRRTTMGHSNPSYRALESRRIKEVTNIIDAMSDENVYIMYRILVTPLIQKLQSQIEELDI